MQLKIKLERKSNDELSESFMKSGNTFAYGHIKKERLESEDDNYRTKEHRTI